MNHILDIRNGEHIGGTPEGVPPIPPRPSDARVRRVLLLALAFFLSGLVFFVMRMDSSRELATVSVPVAQESKPVQNAPHTRLSSLPPPASFRSFQYQASMDTLSATATCADRFSVIMLYASGDDYRELPQSAVYNVASPCARGTSVHADVPLASLHLTPGDKYYLVRAHQGAATWYNPY